MNVKDVLVVDDDDGIRGVIGLALSKARLSYDHAGHGEAALDRMRATDYAVVLLDLMMPVLSGTEVLLELQRWQQPADRRPVVLIMTAFPDHDGLPVPGEMAQAIIRKPFDIGELVAIVGGCVGARNAHLHLQREETRDGLRLH